MFNLTFHMVSISPWPLILSIATMNFLSSILMFYNKFNMMSAPLNSLILMLISTLWWRDVVRESTMTGNHSIKVMIGLKQGMILFISSEVMLFFSFFWTYMNFMLSPDMNLGLNFPPLGIKSFDPLNIPLLNTIILLSSGMTLTWSHHKLMNNMKNKSIMSLALTLMLGLYFTLVQITEYFEAPFSFNDSSYGSIFFMATGFHGAHVIIGSIFILISMKRMMMNQFSNLHHLGFELAAWYWHFVDVVWLLLFLLFYWLPS